MIRLRNKIATGKITLFVTILYGVVALVVGGAWEEKNLYQCILLGIATLQIILLNNSNSLIRVYSRLVSCTFLILTIAASVLLPSIKGAVQSILFIIALQLLFQNYQQKNNPQRVFYAFACIGMMSITYIHSLLFVPILIYMAFSSLQQGSLRNFFAALLGIIVPYWALLPFALWHDGGKSLLEHILTATQFNSVCEGLANMQVMPITTLTVILAFIGIIYYMKYSFEDNIRTRMFFHTLIMLFLFTTIFIILQPSQYDTLLRILIITASPIIAQYFVFAKSRFADILFIISIILIITLTVYNSWTY